MTYRNLIQPPGSVDSLSLHRNCQKDRYIRTNNHRNINLSASGTAHHTYTIREYGRPHNDQSVELTAGVSIACYATLCRLGVANGRHVQLWRIHRFVFIDESKLNLWRSYGSLQSLAVLDKMRFLNSTVLKQFGFLWQSASINAVFCVKWCLFLFNLHIVVPFQISKLTKSIV